jgi:predicted RNA-binding Zn-ribbon protein involved in translation (DUF1610 family)
MTERHYWMDCPDCGNPRMVCQGEKLDLLTGKKKKSFRCPQCRRWAYAKEFSSTQ